MALAVGKPEMRPPSRTTGPIGWLSQNLFSSVTNSVLTLVGLWLIYKLLIGVLDWAFVTAIWNGPDGRYVSGWRVWEIFTESWATKNGAPCRVEGTGACWPFIANKFPQFIYGRYPLEERWRVDLTLVLLVGGLVALMLPRIPGKIWSAGFMFLVFPSLAFWLLNGRPEQPTVNWFDGIAAGMLVGCSIGFVLGLFRIKGTVGGLVLLAGFIGDLLYSRFAGSSAAGSLGFPFMIALLTAGLCLCLQGLVGGAGTSHVRGILLGVLVVFGLILLFRWLTCFSGLVNLPPVKTELWGGLLVTLVVALVGIAGAFPVGILLALGRRSKMPIVQWVSVGFIEFIRGVPLITILFMSSVMLPLFLPDGVSFDKLFRALIGVMLFQGAYMAETIRGGLQAIPRGQAEAADALGLSYPQKMTFIVLPQALKLVIPGIVNSFVGLFKDTSLVLIIGLFDLLGIVQLNSNSDPNWSSPTTNMTGYVFAALIFWMFCYGISRYSQSVERRLAAGERT